MTASASAMNDPRVRERLVPYLEARGYRPLGEISLASNKTRIDVIGMNDGVLCGFEIKSEADDLKKLKKQARRYRRYFEQLYLVAAERHVQAAMEMLPRYWGIWVVRPSASGVHIVRKAAPARTARTNTHQKAAPLAELMWKAELIDVLSAHAPSSSLEALTWPELTRIFVERHSVREIEHYVFEALHARKQAQRVSLEGPPREAVPLPRRAGGFAYRVAT